MKKILNFIKFTENVATKEEVIKKPISKSSKKVTELDVANRFIQEMMNKGESIKKYVK